MIKKSLSLLTLLVLSAGFTACGGDDDGGGTGTETTFQGAIAFDSGEDGTIEINVPEEALSRLSSFAQGSGDVNITGECIFPGGTVPLEGTIDSSTGAFTLEGGDYTFTGTLINGVFSGTLEFNGDEAGSFSGVDSTGEEVKIYCGTFESEDSGVFLVVVAGNTITGSYAGNFERGTLEGTVDGESFHVDSSGGGGADGTISGSSVSGTITNENEEPSGTFVGSEDGCST